MKLRQYQVDAFATRVFEGNPAAVVPLPSWPDDRLLQALAEENNLSETAFFTTIESGFELRWFTPRAEVDLCGHATLASAHVIFSRLGYPGPVIHFSTRSGLLSVRKRGTLYAMDFPVLPPTPCAPPEGLAAGLGIEPVEVLVSDRYVAILPDEARVRAVAPDFSALARLDLRGVVITAAGTDVDFVSRYFAPKLGVDEDPVTGSAHCVLAPYWSARLGKTVLTARQVSRRGGDVGCEISGERVILTGSAVTFMEAEIFIGDEAFA
jgi:predicted PhzF superfamily epimerase YddE/YHI9